MIDDRIVTKMSTSEFVVRYMNIHPKPILFWDTCALLEIIRFCFRQEEYKTFECILNIADKIANDDIYSVSSELTVLEWNDNEPSVLSDTIRSINQTRREHKMAVQAINGLAHIKLRSSDISLNHLEQLLENVASQIIDKTLYIKSDEVAVAALNRIAHKKHPAGKKSKAEFKDCAFWETMCALADSINSAGSKSAKAVRKVFFTVNTDDFADKSITPFRYHPMLMAEATTKNFRCVLTFVDAYSNIKKK